MVNYLYGIQTPNKRSQLPVNLLGSKLLVWGFTRLSVGTFHPSEHARSFELGKVIIKTHGHTSNGIISPTYSSWDSMMRRCYAKYRESYIYYGARGIKVCDEWHSFNNFLRDMGEKPEGLSLGRIDNNGDYCKENCRWETWIQQNNNSRRNKFISFNGKTLTSPQWARLIGITTDSLKHRILKGWTIEKALTTPQRITKRTNF